MTTTRVALVGGTGKLGAIIAAVIGGVVLFLMLLTIAALPLLQEWGEQR